MSWEQLWFARLEEISLLSADGDPRVFGDEGIDEIDAVAWLIGAMVGKRACSYGM